MKFSIASILFLPLTAIATGTNALPPLAPAYPEIPPTFWQQHGTVILIGGFIFLVLVVIALWKILQPKPQPDLPPVVLARTVLTHLQRQPEDGKVLSEVSQTLRHYVGAVGAVFGFPSDELTTAEFLAELARTRAINLELGEAISRFLRKCDERKFSQAGAASPLNAASRALELVDQVEKRCAHLQAQNPAPK